MKKIIIAVSVTLVFVQLVKSQTDEAVARAVAQICREIYSLRMQADDFCTGVNAIPNLFICEPTCRNVIEDLSDKCDNGNGVSYQPEGSDTSDFGIKPCDLWFELCISKNIFDYLNPLCSYFFIKSLQEFTIIYGISWNQENHKRDVRPLVP